MVEEDFRFQASNFLSCISHIDVNIAKKLIDEIHYEVIANKLKETYCYWEEVLFIAIASQVSPEATSNLWSYVDATRLAESFLEDKALYYFANVGDANPMLIQDVLRNLELQEIADCLSWTYPCSWISEFINYIKCKNEDIAKVLCEKLNLELINERLITMGDDISASVFIETIKEVNYKKGMDLYERYTSVRPN
jgi:hypothetical protein